jgi:hypothetical protein
MCELKIYSEKLLHFFKRDLQIVLQDVKYIQLLIIKYRDRDNLEESPVEFA